jgi:hypothetical protein
MKKLLRTTVIKLFCLFKGAFCGALISIAPVALIHHKDLIFYFSHLNWSAIIFFSLSILTASFSFISLSILFTRKTAFVIGYLFFYTACAALCQRIGLTPFAIPDQYQYEPHDISAPYCLLTTVPGTILICLAAAHFVRSTMKLLKDSSVNNKHTHSFYLSCLLFMGGIPLIFGVWLPLIAIPGVWVITRWLD